MAVMNQVVQPESKILKDGAGEKARVVEVEGSGVGGESASEDEGGDSEEESDSDEDGEEEVEEKSGDVNKPVGLSGNGGCNGKNLFTLIISTIQNNLFNTL